MPELIMLKTSTFINGYSLKKGDNEVHGGLRHPRRAGLKTIYTALLISTMERPFSSIKALPKYVFNSS